VTRLRAALARRRPTTRAGVVKGILAGGALVVLLAVASVALAVVVPWVYGEYGFHPEENARSWAALTPQFADSTLCQRCHQAEYTPWKVSKHATVACESCHGPLAQHAATAPEEAPSGSLGMEKPAAGLCAACHEQGPGKPDGFATVDLAAHYAGGTCTGCHDGHAATAVRPHDISHPLANLPACVTCHVPAGLKPVPAGHVESSDAVCLSCHKQPAAGQ
jgi:uncharacterized paraquat-inducible protein A